MEKTQQIPHVIILPFPAQGHVKPMFKLAELLSHANFQVTFINSDHNHDRLIKSIDIRALNQQLPSLTLKSLADGLPPEHPRSGPSTMDLFSSTVTHTKPLFKDLLRKFVVRPTCVIADGIMSSVAIDVAEELGLPLITFRTYSATCTWLYFHIEKLIHEREIPFTGNEDMDRPITCIPGLENLIRQRDLPGICRFEEVDNPILQFYITQTSAMTRASGLIINTFEELESPTITKLKSLFPKFYSIGPLHALLPCASSLATPSGGSLRIQDSSCMTWLDSQPSKSVLYVSFGSVVTLTRDQLIEFWYGVENSGKPFLWVIRPDLVAGESGLHQIPNELQEGTKNRGFMVEWAPQEEVLLHDAIGGFLTHSGWNSTLEGIFAGVPMIAWPQVADQQVNSRCISDLWRIGFDIKDSCDRALVEKMVRNVMEDEKNEQVLESCNKMAKMARDSIKQGGSSCSSLEKLIGDIRAMCLK